MTGQFEEIDKMFIMHLQGQIDTKNIELPVLASFHLNTVHYA